jgi:hypothetical protein
MRPSRVRKSRPEGKVPPGGDREFAVGGDFQLVTLPQDITTGGYVIRGWVLYGRTHTTLLRLAPMRLDMSCGAPLRNDNLGEQWQ